MVKPPRSQHRILWIVAFGLTGFIAASGLSHWLTPKELIPWRNDFKAAQAESRQTGKPMFVYFTAEWCGPCQSMKRTTWADGDVEQALRAYIPTRVDVDQNQALALQYQTDSVPQYFVMKSDGTVLKHNAEGGLPSQDFLNWLQSDGSTTQAVR